MYPTFEDDEDKPLLSRRLTDHCHADADSVGNMTRSDILRAAVYSGFFRSPIVVTIHDEDDVALEPFAELFA